MGPRDVMVRLEGVDGGHVWACRDCGPALIFAGTWSPAARTEWPAENEADECESCSVSRVDARAWDDALEERECAPEAWLLRLDRQAAELSRLETEASNLRAVLAGERDPRLALV